MTRLPEHFSTRHPGIAWFGGILAGTVATGALYAGILFLYTAMQEYDVFREAVVAFGLPSFFVVPMLGGITASYCWRGLHPGFGATARGALGVTLLGLAGAALAFGEGIICLLIVSPLLFIMICAGALLGRIWFQADSSRLRLCMLPVLALYAAGEPFLREDRVGVVADEMLIRAKPTKVWPELTAFPAIPGPPQFWMFRIGLPYPMETTSEGDFVGAGRRCVFSGGMVFGETVARCDPGRELAFDIVSLPEHPELIGHVTPRRGQFLLRDNGDGTTTLTGSTWYTLHVRPLAYFDWWTHHIFRAVHLRVMEDVRRRAEAG